MRSGRVWVAITAWAAVCAWLRWTPSGISWHFFPAGAGALFGPDGLHLYARQPQLQIGPLTFVVVEPFALLPADLGRHAAQVVMMAAGVLALWLVSPLIRNDHAWDAGPDVEAAAGGLRRRQWRLLAAALVLMPPWSVLAVRWMHPDDVLALVLAAAALRAVKAERAGTAGAALGLAVAAKPWAIGFVPVLACLPLRAAARGTLVAGISAAAAWLPFLARDAGTLAALRPAVTIADTSVLRLGGITGTYVPSWTRTVQLLAAPAVALIAVMRRRWPAVMLVAIAVRLALDPQDLGYYEAGAVFAALVVDLALTATIVPWTALLTAVLLWHPFVVDYATRLSTATGAALFWFNHPHPVAIVHLTWSAGAIALALLPPALPAQSTHPALAVTGE